MFADGRVMRTTRKPEQTGNTQFTLDKHSRSHKPGRTFCRVINPNFQVVNYS